MKIKTLIIILIALITVSLTSCNEKINSDDYDIARQSYYLYLDTVSTVTVEYLKSDKTTDEVNRDLNNINKILLNIEKEFSIEQTLYMASNGILESTLMKVNNASGKNKVNVSDEFIHVLSLAQDIYKLSDGGFDPSIGPLTRLWDISGKTELSEDEIIIPTKIEINNVLDLVDYNNVEIDTNSNTVYLSKEGMMLDLGGIAKGYAADKVMEYLKQLGYTYISVNLGGNLLLYGSSKIYESLGKKVYSYIQNPFDTSTTIIQTDITNVSIVTSGIYERYIEKDDIKFHHILDPKTGYPIDNELVMVTIIGSNSCMSDGLSTGVFSLGLDRGIELIKSCEEYSAFFVTKDNIIYSVGNIEFSLTQTGKDNFKLIKVE